MVEVIGNLIHHHLAIDPTESAAKSMFAYYDILMDRFRDIHSNVRCKVLQVLCKLAE